MEYSLFMIKPIAYEHKQEILDIIKKITNCFDNRCLLK